MSFDQHIHLGPYIECKYRPTKREVEAKGCTKSDCSEYKRRDPWGSTEGFCPKCGTKRGTSKMLVDDHPDHIEVTGGESLYPVQASSVPKDTLWLMPNQTHKGQPACLGFDFERGQHLDLSGATWNIHSDIAWMEQVYAKEIEKLKTAFDDVTVKWGLHVWFS